MFNVYDKGVKITLNAITYNKLLKMFEESEIPWYFISRMSAGKSFKYKDFIIVREL